MTKEEKEAKKKKLAAALAKLDGDDGDGDGDDDAEEADPRESKITDLIAKGVDKAIDRRMGKGGTPPKRKDKGVLDSIAEIFGVKE